MAQSEASQLTQSARKASSLIGLQIGSRASTFIVNQILLRFLSPELLGVSNQLDLFLTTVLTFSRESLRISLGRQSGVPSPQSDVTARSEKKSKANGSTKAKAPDSAWLAGVAAQEIVNLAYLGPLLSLVLAISIGYLYLGRTSLEARQIPYMRSATYIYGGSAVLELLAEPCFAIIAQNGPFAVRARAETLATLMRCFVTCAVAAWSSKAGLHLGAIPFAAGQLSYALSLNAVYWFNAINADRNANYSMLPRFLHVQRWSDSTGKEQSRHIAFLFAKPVLFLALTLYGQSVFKHFLTQGDSFLVSMSASLASQGAYALASNYGSLLARMLFQPIEESSRGVLASLLGAATTTSRPVSQSPKENIKTAKSYLERILRFYFLMTLGIVSLGPHLAPLALQLVAGAEWADSEAAVVLSKYCYYLPLLAFNGVLEAFVAATATPAQLRTQSIWMFIFFVVFATAGYVCLEVLKMGAVGLVAANSVNMIIRICWSGYFVSTFFNQRGTLLSFSNFIPKAEVVATAAVADMSLRWLHPSSPDSYAEMMKTSSLAAVFALTIVFLERQYLVQTYRLVRPGK